MTIEQAIIFFRSQETPKDFNGDIKVKLSKEMEILLAAAERSLELGRLNKSYNEHHVVVLEIESKFAAIEKGQS